MTGVSRPRLALASTLIAFGLGGALYLLGGLASLEESSLQVRFSLRSVARPRGIVIVAVDEPSFRALGIPWPFPRSLDGRAVSVLHRAGAREIVYDVQFTEPTAAREDNALITAIHDAGGAVLATTVTNGHGGTDVLGGAPTLRAIHSAAGNGLYPALAGGVIERLPYSVAGLKTLAVVAAERARGRPVSRAGFGDGGALIDFRGPPKTFPTVSFADLVRHRVDPARLRGTIAVIGATAPSLQDLHPTPTGSQLMSGPELQANALWTVLHGNPLSSASDPVALILIALLSALAPVAALRWRERFVGLGALALGVVYGVAAQLAFDSGTVLPVVSPLVSLALGVAGMVLSGAWLEAAERRRLARVLYDSQLELIHRLGQAAESRDQHTGEHLGRIARLTKLLGLAAGMTEHESEMLRHASLMHDIGKVGIPDSVLLKAGTLDAEERALMNTHTEIGGEILSGSESQLVQMAESVARTHHERWDGSGYPAGLRGEEIPLAGRITAICDVFDALVSARVYKPAWPVAETIAELRRLSGMAFDPSLVELFVALVPKLERDLLGGAAGDAGSAGATADSVPADRYDAGAARRRRGEAETPVNPA